MFSHRIDIDKHLRSLLEVLYLKCFVNGLNLELNFKLKALS